MFSIVWLSKYCIKMLSLFFCFIYTQWFNRIRLSFLSINILIYLLFQYSLEGFEILPFGFSPDSPLPLSSHKHTMKPQGVPIHRIETVVFLAEKKDQHVIVCSQIWLAYLSRRTTSAVHSARRYSVTQLLFPVDTVSAWSASRTSGTMKKRVIVSAAALNAKTPFSRGLSWSRTLFWLKWWKEWRSPSVEIMWVLEVSADLLKTVRRQGLRPVMLWVGPDPRRYPEPLESQRHWRAENVLYMTDCWRFTAVMMINASALYAPWLSIKHIRICWRKRDGKGSRYWPLSQIWRFEYPKGYVYISQLIP